jgi:hypothetical protein
MVKMGSIETLKFVDFKIRKIVEQGDESCLINKYLNADCG